MLCLVVIFFFLMIRRPPRSTRTDTPFPTRRSSDLNEMQVARSDCYKRRGFMSTPEQQAPLPNPEPQPKPTIDSSDRSEEHTSELQSLMRISYAVFCLKKKTKTKQLHA